MHLATEGKSSDARLKVIALAKAFFFSLVLRVVSQYAVGILWVCIYNVMIITLFVTHGSRIGILSHGFIS